MVVPKNFTLVKEAFNEYHNGTMALYTHSSGAKVVHMKNSDPDAAFALSFNTPSLSDDGLAHVLEHCVLQGSERFPVSEAYVKTYKGGLYRDMSAGTYRYGHTDYYIGSFIEKSLYNALDVYRTRFFAPFLGRTPSSTMPTLRTTKCPQMKRRMIMLCGVPLWRHFFPTPGAAFLAAA